MSAVNVHRRGSGPAIVFIHGIGSRWQCFAPVMDLLADRYEVIGIDLPEGENIFRPTSTRFAYLAVVDVIASLVAYRNRKQSQVTLRHIKQQLVEHRDGGDDRQLLGD